MLNIVNIDWQCLGATLAILSDEEQKKFFKGLLQEINQFPTHYQKEMQLLFIADGLTKEEKELLSIICYDKGE